METTEKKIFIHFLYVSFLLLYYLFNDFCSRVENGQRYHTKFEPKACREFLILNSIAHCWYNGASKRYIHSIYFYFCFVLFFSLFQTCDAVMREWKRLKDLEKKRAATCFKKLDRFNSFLFFLWCVRRKDVKPNSINPTWIRMITQLSQRDRDMR